jgi:hypothetical protein
MLQPGLDLRAARPEKRRQPRFLAECFHRRVDGKAGSPMAISNRMPVVNDTLSRGLDEIAVR